MKSTIFLVKQFNRETGSGGERLAEEFLVQKGYKLVMRNFRTRYGELDLIMMDKQIMVFVEVKTKKGLNFGLPEEMFTRAKYNQVKRMAIAYLGGKEVKCRIDMVAVEMDNLDEVSAIRYYKNVVLK